MRLDFTWVGSESTSPSGTYRIRATRFPRARSFSLRMDHALVAGPGWVQFLNPQPSGLLDFAWAEKHPAGDFLVVADVLGLRILDLRNGLYIPTASHVDTSQFPLSLSPNMKRLVTYALSPGGSGYFISLWDFSDPSVFCMKRLCRIQTWNVDDNYWSDDGVFHMMVDREYNKLLSKFSADESEADEEMMIGLTERFGHQQFYTDVKFPVKIHQDEVDVEDVHYI